MAKVVLFADASVVDDHLTAKTFSYIPMKGSGVYRIATEVREFGLSCQVISLMFQFTLEELEQVCKNYINKETMIVGFSTGFWVTLNQEKKEKIEFIINFAKKYNSKIIIGGTLSNNFADLKKLDACFDGFAESKFRKYLQSVINKNSPPNPDVYSELGTPIYKFSNDDFDFCNTQIKHVSEDHLNYGEIPVLEVSRGCIFKCDFCFFPLNGKNKFDYIKYQHILEEELIKNYETFGITAYNFSDDTFNDSPYKMEFLHKIFTNLPFNIKFATYLRLDLINAHREQIQQLKEMGLIGAFFGIESLNHKAAKSVGKGMHPDKVKSLLYELKAHHWKDDVNISINLISGLPYETEESMKDTIDWVLDTKNNLVDKTRCSTLTIFNPLWNKQFTKSLFDLNPSTYGYYWPDKNSNEWKNFIHPIHSMAMARELAVEVEVASRKTNRWLKSNFYLMLVANMSPFSDDPKTLEQLNKMSRNEYETYILTNYKKMFFGYTVNYKNNILNNSL